MSYVMEALELEDTVKNYERRSSTGWSVPNYSFYFLFDLFEFMFQLVCS